MLRHSYHVIVNPQRENSREIEESTPGHLGHVPTRRSIAWRDTMAGYGKRAVRVAHSDSSTKLTLNELNTRAHREDAEHRLLAPEATKAHGQGTRAREEEPDLTRTCFEVDRDRILHRCSAFRRLSGKTQVFIFPEDHIRTRLTHALEVTQVASALARVLKLNLALTEAIALGHDCGHGPFGHASEDALSVFLPQGFEHAQWGADVVLEPLNLTIETLDGIRNHSWSRPAPATLEGEVVSWADRIAYVCHDFEDSVEVGIVSPEMLPAELRTLKATTRGRQLDLFITDIATTAFTHGEIGMSEPVAEALAAFRRFNYEQIYNREESLRQGTDVANMLRALVRYYIESPQMVPASRPSTSPHRNHDDAAYDAVSYVAGMTDRFAVRQALNHLGWDKTRLPHGIDLGIETPRTRDTSPKH